MWWQNWSRWLRFNYFTVKSMVFGFNVAHDKVAVKWDVTLQLWPLGSWQTVVYLPPKKSFPILPQDVKDVKSHFLCIWIVTSRNKCPYFCGKNFTLPCNVIHDIDCDKVLKNDTTLKVSKARHPYFLICPYWNFSCNKKILLLKRRYYIMEFSGKPTLLMGYINETVA